MRTEPDSPTVPAACGVPSPCLPAAARSRKAWVILGVILLVGLCLRAVYLIEIARQPTFAHAVYDPQYNDYWARGLVTGDWTVPEGVNDPEIRTTPHGRPPGYPHFLALVYLLFGTGYMAPRLVQMVLGLVNCLLMFLLGRSLFGERVGLVSAAFMAVYWVFIYFEGVLTYPAVAIFVLLCLMHALRHWLTKPGGWRALAVGLALGTFGLFRPNGLLYGPVVAGWMLWALPGKERLRRFVPSALGLAMGTALVLTPAMVRNYVVAKDFVFVSSYGGLNFYVGNNPEASCVEPRIPELRELAGIDNWCCFDYPTIVRGLARKLGREDLKFREANAYFYRKAFHFIRTSPGAFLKKTAKKALLFWGPREVTNDTVMAFDKRGSPLLRWLPGFPAVVALFAVGVLSLYLDRRQRLSAQPGGGTSNGHTERSGQMAAAVILFIAAYFVSVIPFFIAGRYRVPVIPFLLLFGAYGCVRLARFAAERQHRKLFVLLGLGLAVFLLANWNAAGYEPSAATWHFRRALAYAEQGDLVSAIEQYRKAAENDPANSTVHGNLGRLLVKQGRVDDALGAFVEGLSIDPQDSVIHNNLGYELAKLGRTEEAITHYRAALEANPQFNLARNNLGNALMEQGELGKAAGQYRAVIDMDPRNHYSHNNLGYVLARQGQWEKAIEHYQQALRLEPRFARAEVNLADALCAAGRPNEAAVHYARALEINPQDEYARDRLELVQGEIE